MKMLYIANQFSTPPKNGIELINSYQLKYFKRYFDMDILLIRNEMSGEQNIETRKNGFNGNIFTLLEKKTPGFKKLWEELTLVCPSYFSRERDNGLLREIGSRSYDWIWCGDGKFFGFVQSARKLGYFKNVNVAIGLNEPVCTLYWHTFLEVLKKKKKFRLSTLFRAIRSPLIWMHERKYFKNVQLIHVLTQLEKERVENIIGKNVKKRPVIIVAPNGKNDELQKIEYCGGEGIVLYFVQASDDMSFEGEWFLNKVWPQVFARYPDAKLYLVGKGAERASKGVPLDGVVLCGFVDNIAEIYKRASVAVVPFFRGTGIINRVIDAISAGCPLVSTKEALGTVDNLKVGYHALEARTGDEFILAISGLLSDSGLRMKLSRQSNELKAQMPSWDQSVQRISTALSAYKNQSINSKKLNS